MFYKREETNINILAVPELCQAVSRCFKAVPSCSKLIQAVPSCVNIFQTLPIYVKLFQDLPRVSSCVELSRAVSSCFKLFQSVSICFILCQSVSSCDNLFLAVSRFTSSFSLSWSFLLIVRRQTLSVLKASPQWLISRILSENILWIMYSL